MTNKDVAGEHYDMITEIIDRCGVMVQWVGAGVDTAAFAYTVGLAKLDHPELIIFGLSPQTSQGVLNSIDDRSAILCGTPEVPTALHRSALIQPLLGRLS